jgi:hypothetical protein
VLLLVLLPLAEACFDDLRLDRHPCDECFPCQTCVSVRAGIAECRATPAASERCGTHDRDIHVVDSCGVAERTAVSCVNGLCAQDEGGSPACKCRNRWRGAGCAECPKGFDVATDCAECELGRAGADCEQCAVGWDVDSDCTQCELGFERTDDACVDVDECQQTPCGPNAECTNVVGGFRCDCRAGYELQTGDCVDVDECASDNGGCDRRTECTNTPGSRSCGPCPAGYLGNGEAGCTDVDECETRNGGCAILASCRNTPGARRCECPDGYTGDPEVRCDDVNECLASPAPCGDHGDCVNLPGAYECDCDAGFEEDAGTCVDVDECDEGLISELLDQPSILDCDSSLISECLDKLNFLEIKR